MIAALIIVFREVFEAGLIIGIVLAATRSVPHRGWLTAAGIGGGVVGASLVAFFIGGISRLFGGMGQELFAAMILAVAAVMLTWHNVWMARHGRDIAHEMRAAGAAVAEGSRTLAGLSVVVGIAVLREGSEVALFLYGIATDGSPGFALLAGGMLGLALGAAVSAVTYFGLVAIPARYLFGTTTVLITFLAAGMVAQSIAFLEQANAVQWLDVIVWDTSAILPDMSMAGRGLHTLLGYTDRPTALQLLAYCATLALTLALMKMTSRRPVPSSLATR